MKNSAIPRHESRGIILSPQRLSMRRIRVLNTLHQE
jgi:hypothetical protein